MRVPLVELKTSETAEVFYKLQNDWGRIPNLFKALANRPEIMSAVFTLISNTMRTGILDQKLKELIALRVSQINNCDYCIKSITMRLRRMNVTDDQLRSVETRGGLSKAEEAALRYAEQITYNANAITDSQFAELKKHFSDSQIVEITAAASLFNYVNRMVDTLRIPFNER